MTPVQKRRMIYQHNGLRGSCKMMQAQCISIMTAYTPTDAAKAQAEIVLQEAAKLHELLNARRRFQGDKTNEDQ